MDERNTKSSDAHPDRTKPADHDETNQEEIPPSSDSQPRRSFSTVRSKPMDDHRSHATSNTNASSKSSLGKIKKGGIGLAAAGLVILGMYLANLWKGPGFGGPGDDSGSPQTPVDQMPVSTSVKPSQIPKDPTPGTQAEQHITVVLHKNQFRLASYDTPKAGIDVALETIVERAMKMKGDDKGVKVYILFEKSAQEGSRSDLLTALETRGVKRGEILEITGFVD